MGSGDGAQPLHSAHSAGSRRGHLVTGAGIMQSHGVTAELAGQLGPEAMELNRRIKAALDPDGILNPGAVV